MRLRNLMVLALLLLAAAPAAALAADPPVYDPDSPPPGANDFACKPSAAHPRPIVLVHGLTLTAASNWYVFSPKLAAAGYCVFALTYGRETNNPPPFDNLGGLTRMEDSARQVGAFIDQVLAATGASKVDIVGHSEGTLVPDYYLKFDPAARYPDGGPLGGQLKIDRYVAMTPLWQGTTFNGPGTYGNGYSFPGCGSCMQAIAGSDFIQKIQSGPTGPRVPGVTYTTIMTTHDELVTPYTSGYMDGPPSAVTNIVLQDQCPADPSEHVAEAADPLVYQNILNALDPARTRPVDCTTAFPVGS